MDRLLRLSLLSCAWLLACQPVANDLTASRIVDMSHAYGADTIFWPTDLQGFVLENLADGMTEQGYYYAANRFSAAEHGGTHIDAPIHFAEGHPTVDRIPLERLVGAAVLVDVSARCAGDPDYQVGVNDFEGWEAVYGRIPASSIVLLRTGFAERWPDRGSYLGTQVTGEEAVPLLHFPGLHPDAALWLAEQRSIKAVGLDTASIDYGQSALFESHRILFAHDIPAFENLTGLDQLPNAGFRVVALPMKIRGGSGGPLRAIALVP